MLSKSMGFMSGHQSRPASGALRCQTQWLTSYGLEGRALSCRSFCDGLPDHGTSRAGPLEVPMPNLSLPSESRPPAARLGSPDDQSNTEVLANHDYRVPWGNFHMATVMYHRTRQL